MRLAVGLSAPQDQSERRLAGIAQGAAAGAGARGVAVLASLVSVPLSLGYLGAERYGAWMAIVSILGWLSLTDLGFSNHLLNALSTARGRQDKAAARLAISTAFFSLAGVAFVVLTMGLTAGALVPWGAFLNVRSAVAAAEVNASMLVALVLFSLGLPLFVVERVYVADQRGAVANAWSAAASLAALGALVVTTRTTGGLVALVFSTLGAALAVKVVNVVWLFWRERPELRPVAGLVTRSGVAAFLGRSSEFFLIQVAALVLFSTDNIVIAAVLGADAVPPYSATWSLFSLSTLAISVAFPYLWSAYAEALGRGDFGWVVRAFKASLLLSGSFTLVILVPLAVFGRWIVEIWAGPLAVPEWQVVAWMVLWNAILATAMCISCFLNASGNTRFQARVGLLTAVANVALSIVLARSHGRAGVIAATVVTYLAFAAGPTTAVALREIAALKARQGARDAD